MLVNILGITGDAKCYEMVRRLRWPEGVYCPHCVRTGSSSRGGMRLSRNGSSASAGPAAAASMT
jgi:hypothetical protein